MQDSSEVSLFNIEGYYRRLDSDVSFTVLPVTGGVVNVTARIVKSNEDVSKGKFPGVQSVILKFAPPFVAKVGKDAPFSQFRQTIEARALSLFSTPSNSGVYEVASQSNVSVPSLLHYDADEHVLIIADMGSYPDLSDIFSDLGGHHPALDPVNYGLDIFNGKQLDSENVAYFREVGKRVGTFFRKLHSQETRDGIPNRSDFNNPDAQKTVLDHAVKPVVNQIREYLGPEAHPEAVELGEILMGDAVRDLHEGEESFTLGDCWTSAVLTSPPRTGSELQIGVIDWEFAGFARGVHGDMAQLMAHLEMLRISASQSPRFLVHLQALNQLVSSLTDAYAGNVRINQPTTSLIAVKLRSAFIACGVEMINCALWKKWTCTLDECRLKDGSHPEAKECLVVRSILKEGVSLIRLARQDVESFCSDTNWSSVQKMGESGLKRDQNWLIDLF